MKVMTFNIQHLLYNPEQRIDAQPFAGLIQKYEADFCGLNEVRGDGPADDYTDQTNALGDLLGFFRYFGQAISIDGNPYGNAVVSRYPIQNAETFLIPDPEEKIPRKYYESRSIIRTVLNVDGTDVCLLVCHMGLVESERHNAVAALCQLIDECSIPLIVMGDFNAQPNSEELQPLFARLQDSARMDSSSTAFTFASYLPQCKIDYILYRGLECTSAQIISEIVSDHFPILAEFKLPSQ